MIDPMVVAARVELSFCTSIVGRESRWGGGRVDKGKQIVIRKNYGPIRFTDELQPM